MAGCASISRSSRLPNTNALHRENRPAVDLPSQPTTGQAGPAILQRYSLSVLTAHFAVGQVPVLGLADGTCISETVAICRYLDAIQPDPPLFGRTPATAALIEHHIVFGESNGAVVARGMTWLDADMADGRPFVVGQEYGMAEIALPTMVEFGDLIGLDPIGANDCRQRWRERFSATIAVS